MSVILTLFGFEIEATARRVTPPGGGYTGSRIAALGPIQLYRWRAA